MGLLPGWLTAPWTIGRQIGLAFAAMGGVTATLAGAGVLGTRQADSLVDQSMNQGLVAAQFTRAVSEDFEHLRAEVSRSGQPRGLTVAVLDKSFKTDLAALVDQAPTSAVSEAGASLGKAEAEWLGQARRIDPASPTAARERAELETLGKSLGSRLEGLVGQVVDLAYDHRQAAGRLMAAQSTIAAGGGLGAILVAGLAAVLLSRSLRSPLKRATEFAHAAALGEADPRPPKAGSDEIGTLVNAVTAMHREAKNRTAAERARHAHLHSQVAEALDGSREGVLVADGRGEIQIVNNRALDFLGIGAKALSPGSTLDQLRRLVGLQDATRQALLAAADDDAEPRDFTLPDGRRIRCNRNRTSDGGFAGLYSDVTALVTSKEDLAAAKANLDSALANMSQALCLFDADRVLKVANSRFYTLFHLDPAEVRPGTSYDDILAFSVAGGNHPGLDPDRLRRHERFVFGRGHRLKRTVPFRDGRILSVVQAPMLSGGRLVTCEDITEQRRINDRITHVARHDALTGLANRAVLMTRTDRALARSPGGVGLLVVDLDGFKAVNDTLGPDVGDALLKAASERILPLVPPQSIVARLGGDEFAVLLPRDATRAFCTGLAQRIIEALGAPFEIGASTLRIGASLGIAVSPADGKTPGQLTKAADLALHKAKDSGRNAVRLFEPEMENALNARLSLEADLRRAMAEGEFEVYYQPLLDLASMRIGGFEALIRWNHPTRGLVPPGAFIPTAENMGIIDKIGAWVLGEACRDAMRWPGPLKVAVNVSIVQLRNGGFADIARKALASSRLPPGRLELEITESVFMANNAEAMTCLKALKELGVRFSMDDFGTGYSSLSTLRRFPFDKIKIDRAFVADAVDGQGEHILKTIVALGKNLGMRVTAEGVETPRQLKHMADVGCDDVQGYLIGRPMPAGAVIDSLEHHNGRAAFEDEAA